MKVLYNRYLDSKARLFIPIERFMDMDNKENTEPSFVKLLNVAEEKTEMVPYTDLKKYISEGTLKQIL